MVFKWFKARISMNVMPAHSSAVAGSYRISAFDETPKDFIGSNNRGEGDSRTRPEPNQITRPVSEPVLYDPIDDTSSKEVPKSSRKKPAPKPTARSQGELNRIDDDDGGMRTETVEQKFNESMPSGSPRPIKKMSKTEYKRKKVKAPAPKPKFSNDSTKQNRSTEFVTIKDKRKTSEGSDFEV